MEIGGIVEAAEFFHTFARHWRIGDTHLLAQEKPALTKYAKDQRADSKRYLRPECAVITPVAIVTITSLIQQIRTVYWGKHVGPYSGATATLRESPLAGVKSVSRASMGSRAGLDDIALDQHWQFRLMIIPSKFTDNRIGAGRHATLAELASRVPKIVQAGEKSTACILEEIGYLDQPSALRVEAVEVSLELESELMDMWLARANDQRLTGGWGKDVVGADYSVRRYAVGECFEVHSRSRGCAEFVVRYLRFVSDVLTRFVGASTNSATQRKRAG